MKKVFFLVALALSSLLSARAADGISTATARLLNSTPAMRATADARKAVRNVKSQLVNGIETIQAFVHLNDGNTDDIIAAGGTIHSHFGDNMVLATLPVNSINALAAKSSIKQVAVAQMMSLKTDKARQYTGAEQVWDGINNGLGENFDGTGVVLGIIDSGIEYNHLAFKDADGNSRVKRVYDPRTSATGGSTVTINGETLTGRQYTTASQIAGLTCDTEDESHGTHTSGCAGGSRVGNYSGMAPGVDLVLCGCGDDLTDANIAECVRYIAEYAKSVGKPCVISISLGSNVGPHDGKSNICLAYDALVEEYDYNPIILLACGNEADMNASLVNQTITDADTPLATYWSASGLPNNYAMYGNLDIWNNTSSPLQVQFVIMNSSNVVQTITSKITPTANGVTVNGISDYFGNGSLTVYGGVDENNNRYNIMIDGNLQAKSSGWSYTRNRIGVLIFGSQGDVISMWTDSYYSELSSATTSYQGTTYNFKAGNGSNSLCDDVTGNNTISIGAIASRLTIPYNYGSSTTNLDNGGGAEGSIAYFSSYGTDFNGVDHPYISAPGHSVVSSINRYDSSSAGSDAAARVSLGSSNYDYWEYMSGTSMATPVAAGCVALWKQIAPQLTVAEAKTVMAATAKHDTYFPNVNVRWGQGRLDALAGAEYLLSMYDDDYTPGDVNNDALINVFDVVSTSLFMQDKKKGIFKLKAADLNGDGEVDITDLVGIVNLSLGLEASAPAPRYALAQNGDINSNAISIAPVSLKAGESREIQVALNNSRAYTALQLDMRLPAGVTASNARMTSRAADHAVALSRLSDGSDRLFAYSNSNELFDGNEGTILTFTVTADDSFAGGELNIDRIVLVERSLETTVLEPINVSLSGNVTTAVDAVDADALRIFAAGGAVVIDTPEATVATIAAINGAARTIALNSGRSTIALPAGFYIVKIGDKAVKLSVK